MALSKELLEGQRPLLTMSVEELREIDGAEGMSDEQLAAFATYLQKSISTAKIEAFGGYISDMLDIFNADRRRRNLNGKR